MRNFYLIALFQILFFTSSCIEAENSYSPNKRIASKYSTYTKPSESMQAGLPKAINYKFKKAIQSNNDYFELVDAIGQSTDFIDYNQEYEGYFKIGNPYEVFGTSYVPQNYQNFEEIGIASWYGDDFHGKATATGEVYNMGSMTAAHKTLPLPSVVRVTNLSNNKTVIVRVNDRGPFAKNRVIDMSEKAATLLGFKDQGTAEVKVELLREETDEMLKKLNLVK
jgi:rare lipoprotein A (peptidoglycan hydrolase)